MVLNTKGNQEKEEVEIRSANQVLKGMKEIKGLREKKLLLIDFF